MLRGLTSPGVPGAVAVVLQGERAVAQAAVGVADLATDEPATMSTPYLWFSLTKIATATAVMQLADKDLLRLDDAVSRYVPEFPRPRRSWPAVTIKHLLSHSSGLANPLPLRWVHAADDAPRETAAFTSDLLRRHGRLRFPAGQRASYSNLGYLALGEVVASVAARPYVDYVAAEILAPLGMSHTGFRYPSPSPRRPRGITLAAAPLRRSCGWHSRADSSRVGRAVSLHLHRFASTDPRMAASLVLQRMPPG